jgi:hypothetical protein
MLMLVAGDGGGGRGGRRGKPTKTLSSLLLLPLTSGFRSLSVRRHRLPLLLDDGRRREHRRRGEESSPPPPPFESFLSLNSLHPIAASVAACRTTRMAPTSVLSDMPTFLPPSRRLSRVHQSRFLPAPLPRFIPLQTSFDYPQTTLRRTSNRTQQKPRCDRRLTADERKKKGKTNLYGSLRRGEKTYVPLSFLLSIAEVGGSRGGNT